MTLSSEEIKPVALSIAELRLVFVSKKEETFKISKQLVQRV